MAERSVRIPDRRARMPLVRDIPPDVAIAFGVGLRHHVFCPGDVGVVGDPEPRSDLIAHLHTSVENLVRFRIHIGVENTVVAVVTS